MAYKWMVCVRCNRIVKNIPSELKRHNGHKPIRYACDEPWYHVLYRPELLLDWLKLKLGRDSAV